MKEDCIRKRKLDVILLIDTSKSMNGKRIEEVNNAIRDIKDYLIDYEKENINVDFHITLITFGTLANFHDGVKSVPINDFEFNDINCYGQTNIHLGYELLYELLAKESNGGIMPDFGGLAPIILLLTDGHPGKPYGKELDNLYKRGWFKYAIRYGLAIGLNDERTKKVVKDFVGQNGDIFYNFSPSILAIIIKVIVLTSSKIKSSSSKVNNSNLGTPNNQLEEIKQEIKEALSEEVLSW